MKILAGQGLTADVKFGHMVKIPTGIPCVVLTNFDRLFVNSDPLLVRVFRVHFTRRTDWNAIDEDYFLNLVKLISEMFRDLPPLRQRRFKYCNQIKDFDVDH